MKPHAGKVADGFRYAFRKRDPMQANQLVGWLDRRSERSRMIRGPCASLGRLVTVFRKVEAPLTRPRQSWTF